MNAKTPSLGVVFLTVFIDLVGFGLVIPLVSLYGQAFQADGIQLGLLGAGYSLMGFLAAPFWGRLSDRYGRRPVLLLSIAGTALSHLGFALAGSWAALLSSRLLAGLFSGNIAAAQAVIADITPQDQRARGMGMVGAAFGLGFILGPSLGGLSSQWGLMWPGLIAAGLSTLNFGLAWRLLPETLPKERRAQGPTRGLPLPLDLDQLRAALRHPTLWALLLCSFGATLAFSNVEQCFSLLLKDHFSWDTLEAARKTGWVLSWLGLLAVLVQGGLIRPLAKRFGEERLLAAGLLFQVFGIGLLPWFNSYGAFFLGMVPLALGSGLINPSLSSLVSKSAAVHEQGSALGLMQGLGSLARALGPFIGLSAFERSHHLPFSFGAALVGALFFLGLWLALKVPKRA